MKSLSSELYRYNAAITFDRTIPRELRQKVNGFLVIALFLILAVGVVTLVLFDNLFFIGIFAIVFGFYLESALFTFYYNTFYYYGIELLTHGKGNESGLTYEAAFILSRFPRDVTKGFFQSPYGREILLRVGILEKEREAFLASPRMELTLEAFQIPEKGLLTLAKIGKKILEQDAAFGEFLQSRGIAKETFHGALSWVAQTIARRKHREHWWSIDNLMKMDAIGRDLSYGVASNLAQYLRGIESSGLFGVLTEDDSFAGEALQQVTTILLRAREANVLLVGETSVGTKDLLLRLQDFIKHSEGTAIGGKDVVVFDSEAFVATHNAKESFERAFIEMFIEAEAAGNLIVVFENFPQLLQSVEAFGTDLSELLSRFLSSAQIQFIATTDASHFHQHLETRPKLLGQFEMVRIENTDASSVLRVLEDVALAYEARGRVVFTYAALVAIAASADRYIVDGVMPDKAVDLIAEIIPVAEQKNTVLITSEFVFEYVGGKTGIPTGPIQAKERDTLLNLETVLHKRVIGQDSAVNAVASAMRRARSGINAGDRPMGSFLFLGPTGVGKTETAKALAHVFFGDEDKMVRLDMSEFSGGDALQKLLGDEAVAGVLPNLLREHPYCVLLVDEFEKSSPQVRNLFLQILDEGIFSDSRGEKVNARNTIIIATSNAGSDLIWEISGRGEDASQKKDEIVDTIISRNIYTPELVNRFDGVIVFSPLSQENQKAIATLMVNELAERVKERGYRLEVTDTLLTFLAEKGHDPQFGARPMKRLIQDIVEEKIAKKIIEGLQPGGVISFTPEDFQGKTGV
jgi:ATP-dependent Clp protease ATP-binding subunit ClpC